MFLGVLLDEDLRRKTLDRTFKKVARICAIFSKLNILPINVLICRYNSLFSPFLKYGILVWSLSYETYCVPGNIIPMRLILCFVTTEDAKGNFISKV